VKNCPIEKLSGQRIVRSEMSDLLKKNPAKNCPGEELSMRKISNEELSGRRIVRSKNCPSEKLSSRRIVRAKNCPAKNCPGEEWSGEKLSDEELSDEKLTSEELSGNRMKPLEWLEVPQVPWSQLGGAGSLKGQEMTSWVKGHSYIMTVRAYSSGLGSFRPKDHAFGFRPLKRHKFTTRCVITPVARGTI
jgi:hypothetical protein